MLVYVEENAQKMAIQKTRAKCSENDNSKGKVSPRGNCPHIKWGSADSYYKWALQPPFHFLMRSEKEENCN